MADNKLTYPSLVAVQSLGAPQRSGVGLQRRASGAGEVPER